MRLWILVVLSAFAVGEDAAVEGPFDVTLVTQLSSEKLWIVRELCTRWQGAASFALWLNATESEARVVALLESAAAECAQHGGVSVATFRQREAVAGEPEPYPVNELRNLALRAVNTTHHLVSDIDFLPSRGLRAATLDAWKWLRFEKLALVVPAFQRRGGNCKTVEHCRKRVEPLKDVIPSTFATLSACLSSNMCTVFQAENSLDSHSTTDTASWLTERWVRPISCFHSKRYEPYVVVRHSDPPTPLYDQRFSGYGKNKIQHISHLRSLGFAFAVLPREFLVHVPHPRSESKKKWVSSYSLHKSVDSLYTEFLSELEALPTSPRAKICKRHSRHTRRRLN